MAVSDDGVGVGVNAETGVMWTTTDTDWCDRSDAAHTCGRRVETFKVPLAVYIAVAMEAGIIFAPVVPTQQGVNESASDLVVKDR